MAVNEPARRDGADLRERIEVALRRSFGQKRRSHVRHENVADEEQRLVGKVNKERILRLSTLDRDEPQLQGAMVKGFLSRDDAVYLYIQTNGPAAEELAEGRL